MLFSTIVLRNASRVVGLRRFPTVIAKNSTALQLQLRTKSKSSSAKASKSNEDQPATDAPKDLIMKSNPKSSTPNDKTNLSTSNNNAPNTSSSMSDKKDISIGKKATDAILRAPSIFWFYITQPKVLRKKVIELKEAAVKEVHHLWMGSKLLAADVRTARHIMNRTLRGNSLSRRERKQLLRTVTDVFRLVPMSIFFLVPFMEFALPFALKIFPNMLPSTFQDSLKEEEKMKGELQMRISMAGFFQDTLAELAKEQKKFAQIRKHDADDASDAESIEIEKEATAISFLEFLKKARTGEAIPPDVIITFAKYFEDNLTLDNMGRMQLINMCKYMSIPPYGGDNLLRFQLRHRIRLLKDDDQRIMWEGVGSLTKMELREACRERGMRSTGLSKDAYRKALEGWLGLSVQKDIPISLLIMSRIFFLHDEMVGGESSAGNGSGDGVAVLADAMSGIDKEVLNEIVLEMASSEEKSKNADVMKIQLEVLEQQNEMIKEEQEERDAYAAAKEKEEKDKLHEKESMRESEISSVEESGVKESRISTSEKPLLDTQAVPEKSKQKINTDVDKDEDDEHTELSTAEIDAIASLTSPDPVRNEREELQRIKNKMQGGNEAAAGQGSEEFSNDDLELDHASQPKDESGDMYSAANTEQPVMTEVSEGKTSILKEVDEAIEKEAKEVTVMSTQGDDKAKVVAESYEDELVGDQKLQKSIDRLKSRVETMVGKIETQLSDVEVRIGSKFHLLDKDGDGVLTMEEMAQVLQTVLKRELTPEEAMAIASDIDQNKDGVFSIHELAQWAERATIVQLAEDGREKDLDDMITERVAVLKESEKNE